MVSRKEFHRLCLTLKQRVEEGKHYPNQGICFSIFMIANGEGVVRAAEYRSMIGDYSKSWKHFSGSTIYPVPSNEAESAEDAFMTRNNMWTGAYGAYRRDLLDHLIYKSREPVIITWFKRFQEILRAKY